MAGFVVSASFPGAGGGYDRAKEVKEFDESKIGVKGLVDAGATTIPRFFQHPPSSLAPPTTAPASAALSIPTVDLSLPHPVAVERVAAAAREWGFFQVTNHGVPTAAISAALSAAQAFNEQPTEAKAAHYTRDQNGGVNFNTNFNLYRSDAATWRDTLQVLMAPAGLDPGRIPEGCRGELLAWDEQARGLAGRLMGLLSEGLGAAPGRLEELSCLEGRMMVCHYYPYCPQPELTLGLSGHTDPGVLTLLVQNDVVGLQVRKGGGAAAAWVEVDPIPGAIVINVGDTLQMISNDEYKSVEHKVAANPHRKARVSIAVFYNPGRRDESSFYGPLRELVSEEKPARYRQFTMPEFLGAFSNKGLGPRWLLDHFTV
uniref:1-aminocyclopropane-1-carboxylate oxidase 3 n=1 Tax=Anthurium amnicola TaxID=1678845 RepID=A0A1D1YLM4_9ARAE